MTTLKFPSDQEIEAQAATDNAEIKKWADLPQGLYGVTQVKKVEGKFGTSFIGDLETRDNDHYKAWLTQRLSNEVKDLKLPVFVRHEGLKQSKKSSNKYYAYTLIKGN